MRALILALSMAAFATFVEGSQVAIQTIALTGDAAPGVSAGATFQSMLNPFISPDGDVFFRAQVTGTTGVWKYGQGALTNVANAGEFSRPYSGGTIYSGRPNASGEVLIGYANSSNEGLYVVGPGGGRGIVYEGTQAPGIDGDVYFASVGTVFGTESIFGSGGGVLFAPVLLGSDTEFGNRESLWVNRGGEPTLVARQGVPHPALPAGITFSAIESGVIDAANRVYFEAELSDGREAIWLDDAGVLSNIATAGQQPQGINDPGVTYQDFYSPATNASGTITYWSRLSGAGLSATNDEAIWSGMPGNPQLVVREGTPVGSVDGPLTFTDFGPEPLINAAGQLMLWGTAQESYGGQGLWVGHPGDFRQVVRYGATPPGVAGDIQFDNFTDTVINALGHVVVEGRLAGDDLTLHSSGEGYLDDTGIWFWADGQLTQVVRKGDEVEVRAGDVRRISSIDYYGFVASSGNSDGLASPVGDQDDIALRLRFDDGSSGVFIASVSIDSELSGDFNEDGVVDAVDYVVWRKLNQSAGAYEAWRNNFGNTAGGAAANAGTTSPTVPEPASPALVMLAGVAFSLSRRLVQLSCAALRAQDRGEDVCVP